MGSKKWNFPQGSLCPTPRAKAKRVRFRAPCVEDTLLRE